MKNHHNVFISVTAESLVEGMADGEEIAEIILIDVMNTEELVPDRLIAMRIVAASIVLPGEIQFSSV